MFLGQVINMKNSLISQYLQQFERYYNLIVQHNKKYNLTTIVDRQAVFKKHFLDSLLALDWIESNNHIVDIGCGAGMPSLPLCIVRGDLQATLYDSVLKKVNFCNIVIRELGLQDRVRAIHSRIEDIPKDTKYDICVARAVAKLNTLLEYAIPFVKVGGYLLAYKSNDIEQEIEQSQNAFLQLNAQVSSIESVVLDNDIVRKIIRIQKMSSTPSQYPRGKNLARKSPL